MNTLPSAQVLIFEPLLTHSVWVDFQSRSRTLNGLLKQLRAGVCSGEYVGYRLIEIQDECIGRAWNNKKGYPQ